MSNQSVSGSALIAHWKQALSYEGSNADSDIFAQGGFVRNNPGWDDFTRNDQGHRSPTAAKMDLPGLQAGIEEIHNGFIVSAVDLKLAPFIF